MTLFTSSLEEIWAVGIQASGAAACSLFLRSVLPAAAVACNQAEAMQSHGGRPTEIVIQADSSNRSHGANAGTMA